MDYLLDIKLNVRGCMTHNACHVYRVSRYPIKRSPSRSIVNDSLGIKFNASALQIVPIRDHIGYRANLPLTVYLHCVPNLSDHGAGGKVDEWECCRMYFSKAFP